MLSLMDCRQSVKGPAAISAPGAELAEPRPERARRVPTFLPLSCPRCDGLARAYCRAEGGRMRFHSECNVCGLRFGRLRCTWAQFLVRLLCASLLPVLGAGVVVAAYAWFVWAASGL